MMYVKTDLEWANPFCQRCYKTPSFLLSHVSRFIVSAAILLLTANSPAFAQQEKSASPSPHSQGQLDDRVKDVETRLSSAEQKAATAAMEKDYITRVQKQYESYYKEVFSTQTHILWTIGITVTLLSVTLSVVFFVAGRFGFNIFDRRIDMALRDATAQLRIEFTELLVKETQALREANAVQLKALEEGLTKRINAQEQDLRARSDFQFRFAQGLTLGADKRPVDARGLFRSALKTYKEGRDRGLIPKGTGTLAARNLFRQFKKADNANFAENAKKELADEFYNDLEDELALAAVGLDWLGPLLKERGTAKSPTATEAKAAEVQIEPPPGTAPDNGK